MRVISFNEACSRLKSVLDEVVDDADCTVIPRGDAEDAVMMSLSHYNSLMETLYLLKSQENGCVLKTFDQKLKMLSLLREI